MIETPLAEIPESLVEFNRARYRLELAQAIYEQMRKKGVRRSELADAMGFESRARVTHILSGERNLGADTIADLFLVLGKAAHVALGTNPDAMIPAVEIRETSGQDRYPRVR